eukprot:132427_1
MADDDKKVNTKQPQKSKRKPHHSKHIHIAGYPNSFTYVLCSGKRKVDQSLQRFCLTHKSVGVFEVKVELKTFGMNVKQINKIEYDANDEGISVKYGSKVNGWSLFVPYPKSITVRVPKNPEAIYLGNKIGILSCRLPITDHTLELQQYNAHKQPKMGLLGAKKKRKWNNKVDGKLHRNHAQLSKMQTKHALRTDNSAKLTAFQKSLYHKGNDSA